MHSRWVFLGTVALTAQDAPSQQDATALGVPSNGFKPQGRYTFLLCAAVRRAKHRLGLLRNPACAGVSTSATGGVSVALVAAIDGSLLMAGWAMLAASALRR